MLAPDEQLALDRLTPLLMLFDSQLTSRLSLHSIFRELYGAMRSAVSLLDFYQAYRALPKEDLFARLTGARDPAIARIDALRKQFAALAARACAGASTARPIWARAKWRPGSTRWRRSSMRARSASSCKTWKAAPTAKSSTTPKHRLR
ncbi:hypothetical protein LP419_15440 [Massilia sp. H-1]|nr:hypothetical protein LP419_15440 [Massilia sp. H-1]